MLMQSKHAKIDFETRAKNLHQTIFSIPQLRNHRVYYKQLAFVRLAMMFLQKWMRKAKFSSVP